MKYVLVVNEENLDLQLMLIRNQVQERAQNDLTGGAGGERTSVIGYVKEFLRAKNEPFINGGYNSAHSQTAGLECVKIFVMNKRNGTKSKTTNETDH